MAKKKVTENVIETPPKAETTGQGVGVYYDNKLKKFVLVTLDLVPENNSAVITSKEKLSSSKLSATLKATITLEQLLNKMK